jgi:hypothetical protein
VAQAVNPADPGVRAHLDLNRPSAVLLVAILHFIVDQDRATGIVAGFRDRLAPGSFLVISHVADLPDAIERKERAAVTQAAAALYESLATQLFTLRTLEQVTALFDGFEVITPGIGHLPTPPRPTRQA